MTVPIRAVARPDHLGPDLPRDLVELLVADALRARPDPMSTDTPTVLWTLRNGHRHLARRPDAIH